ERMLSTTDGPPAAQLLYQEDTGRHITLTMRAAGKAGQTSFTFTRDSEGSRFVWQDAHMVYSLVGDMAQEKLLKVAEAVSRDLRMAAQQEEAAQAPNGSGDTGGEPA